MHIRNMRAGLPFALISGQTLGKSHSSFSSIGSFLPTRSFGQAEIKSFVNLATGNLCIEDHGLRFPDLGDDITFSYLYNSKADQSNRFQLSFGRHLKKMEEGKGITLIEKDGCTVHYDYDRENDCYVANSYQDGRPSIYYDKENSCWIRRDPALRAKEWFNTQGQLVKHVDAAGHEICYEYNDDLQLQVIVAASGARYEFKRDKEKIEVYLTTQTTSHLLHTYLFNAAGSLTKSMTPDGYEIEYNYDQNQQLANIRQSDGSLLSYYYEENQAAKLQRIQVGHDAANTFSITYQDHAAIFRDPSGTEAKLFINHDNKQPLSFSMADELTLYCFNSAGQVETISYVDGSEESFEYDNQHGLLVHHIHRDKTETTFHYSDDVLPFLIAKSESAKESKTSPLVSQYIYDRLVNHEEPLLRYEISPAGRVKEYEYNESELIENERTYLADFYSCSDKNSIDLPAIEAWKKALQQKGKMTNTALTHHDYDQQGRVIRIRQFAEVDEQGEGISNDKMAETNMDYDERGHLIRKSIKCSEDQFLHTSYSYDCLDRKTKEILGEGSAIKQETVHVYQDNRIITTLPNGRMETQTLNDQGQLQAEKAVVTIDGREETRLYQYRYDAKERVEIIKQPDNSHLLRFYDHKQRPITTISASGIVSTLKYYDTRRYQIKREYAKSIDQKMLDLSVGNTELFPNQAWLNQTLSSIADPLQDRCNYTFFDVRGRVQFEVDADCYITEYQYDDYGHLLHQIMYLEKISITELQNLCEGEALNRQPDRAKDQIISLFSDDDGLQIAAQDKGGYITEFKRDAGGRVREKMQYAFPDLTTVDEYAELSLQPDLKNDSHTYYFYDGLNQQNLEIDAEGYITTSTFTTDGKKKNSKDYFNRVDPAWYQNTQPLPTIIPSTKDREINHHYDDLRRLSAVHQSSGEVATVTYDEMDHLSAHYIRDQQILDKTDGDYCRGEEYRYDGWEQKTTYANPFVSQLLAKIELSDLSEADKKAERNAIFADFAERSIYDNSNGLKVKTTDPLGNATVYYYDKGRRPVISINAIGAVSERSYNAFDEVIKEHDYYLPISKEILKTLTGGDISDALYQLLKEHPKDVITHFKRDQRGQIIEKTDPEGNISRYEYDAFKQCRFEHLPVNDKLPVLQVEHQYEGRGLEIKTIQATDSDTIITEHTYNHHSGKQTETINASGGRSVIKLDRLGRTVEVQNYQAPDKIVVLEKTAYDAFSRETEKQFADQDAILIDYDDKNRTKTLTHTSDNSQIKIVTNVFGEEIERNKLNTDKTVDNVLHKESKQHAPDGQVTCLIDGLGESIQTAFNLTGKKIEETGSDKNKTTYHYNGANQLASVIKDAGRLNLTTQFVTNTLGQQETTIDARGIITEKQFDRCGNILQTIQDVGENRLNLITQYSHNAQGSLTHKIQGDAENPNQYREQNNLDDLDRLESSIIDPEGLNIQHGYEHDAAGNVVLEQDAEGHCKRNYYDAFKRKCFEVIDYEDNQVSGIAHHYTDAGKLKSIRKYACPINRGLISGKKEGTEVASLFETSADDTVMLYFHDQKGRDRFNVKLLYSPSGCFASVEKMEYDQADRIIKKKQYAASLAVDNEEQLTTSFLEEALQQFEEDEKNRETYYWHDEASQERLIIKKNGSAIQKHYDKAGRIIAESQLFHPVKNPNDYLHQHFKTVPIVLDSKRDRTTCYIYDSCGRIHFIVHPNGQVIRKDYDENDNVVQLCQFKDFVPQAKDYNDLVIQLNKWMPDPNRDAITKTTYDNANRVSSITNALQQTEKFTRDALGNAIAHCNRAGETWNYEFDSANRLIREISPETNVSTVSLGSNGNLTCQDTRLRIKKRTDFDRNNNAIRIVQGEGLSNERVFQADYDSSNQLGATTIHAPVNDPDKPASLTVLPVQMAALRTQVYYGARKQKIAECDTANQWSYYVYDSLGRMIYKIHDDNVVVQWKYNAFDEVEEEHQYATPLTQNLSSYRKLGVPASLLEKTLVKSPEDRHTAYQYDLAGNVISNEKGDVLYYIDELHHGIAKPKTEKRYNVFNECIYEKTWISLDKYTERFTWYDQSGKAAAVVDESNYLKRYFLDAAGQVVQREKYVHALTSTISSDMTLKELDQIVIRTGSSDEVRDRVTRFEYDLLGQKLKEIEVGLIVQDLSFTNKGPGIVDLPKQNYVTAWTYTLLQQVESITYQNDKKEFISYDERGLKSAEIHVPRKSGDIHSRLLEITPKTTFKRNAFGQVVSTVESAESHFIQTVEDFFVISSSLPIEEDWVITGDNKLAEELFCHDARGLLAISQNAVGHKTFFVYEANGDISRKIEAGSQWNQSVQEKCIDEIRYLYNPIKRITNTIISRNNQIEEKSCSLYDVFGQLRAQGEDENNLPLIIKRDSQGRAWFSNADDGVHTISLYDLRGLETLRLQSPVDDLNLQVYENLLSLITADVERIERTEKQYHASGHLACYRAPYWYQDRKAIPTHSYQHDHWGNVVKEINSLGAETDFIFDERNHVIKRVQPAVKVMQEDNTCIEQPLVTRYAFNARGFAIGSIDPKGHHRCLLLDEVGQVIQEFNGDGKLEKCRIFDAQGFITTVTDGRFKGLIYHSDAMGNVTQIIFSGGKVVKYEHDEKNNRIHVDAQGSQTYYSYNARNQLVDRILHDGHKTTMKYDRNGQETHIGNADNTSLEWERDGWFSTIIGHTDLSGRKHKYQYDYKRQMLHHSASGGQQRDCITFHNPKRENKYLYFLSEINQFPVPDTNISTIWKFGRKTEEHDLSLGKLTFKQYDSENRITSIEIKEPDGYLLNKISAVYDAIGREESIINEHTSALTSPILIKFRKNITYDAASNRRHEEYLWHPLRYNNECADVENRRDIFFTYDAADNIIILNGTKRDNSIEITPSGGVKFRYKEGYRVEEEYYGPGNALMTTQLTYNDDGQLISTNVAATNVSSQYHYHPYGYVDSYDQYWPNQHLAQRFEYSSNLWPVSVESWKNDYENWSKSEYKLNEVGLPYHIEINPDKKVHRNKIDLEYVRMEAHAVSSVSAEVIGKFPGAAQIYYEVNGTINAKINVENEWESSQAKELPRVYYETTSDGLILTKTKFNNVFSPGRPSKFLFPFMQYRFIYNVKGQLQGGLYGWHNSMDYWADVNFHINKDPKAKHILPWTSTIQPYFYNRPVMMCSPPKEENNKNGPFGNSYQYYSPPMDPQIHIVKPGDTLELISSQLFGDSIYADKIGEMNGYLLKKTLAPGQVLFLPQIMPARNKADCSRPYHEFVTLITGSVLPHLKDRPIILPVYNDDDDDNFFNRIVKVVAVILVVAAAPHLAAFLLPYIGIAASSIGPIFTAARTIVTGLSAMTLDAGVQKIEMSLGVQRKFSANEMLQMGVGSSVGEYLKLTEAGLADRVFAVAASTTATQLIGMKAGWQKKFDATAVILQAMATFLQPKVELGISKVLGNGAISYSIKSAVANSVVNSLLGDAAYHTAPNITNLAANALGAGIAEAAAGKLSQSAAKEEYHPTYAAELEETELVTKIKLDDFKLPLTDHRYGEVSYGLSEMNSVQRQMAQQNSGRAARWSSEQVKKTSFTTQHGLTMYEKASRTLDVIANSRVISGINSAGARLARTPVLQAINAVNPIVVGGEVLNEAFELFDKGDVSNGSAAVGVAALSIIPIDSLATGGIVSEFAAVRGALAARGLFARSGVESSRLISSINRVSSNVPNNPTFFKSVDETLRYERYWDDLTKTPVSLNNRSVRAWYLSKEMEITSMLDKSLSLEKQAYQAFSIRNTLREKARNLMIDQQAVALLRKTEPNLTWSELVSLKSSKYQGDDLWQSIISSSQRSREKVNKMYGFVGNR